MPISRHLRLLTFAAVAGTMSLAACSEPILRIDAIPPGVATADLLFHRTKWFECAVAVYRLQTSFADQLRKEGLSLLNRLGQADASNDAEWRRTPTPDDMSKGVADLHLTMDCLKDAQPYASAFANIVSSDGGYYRQNRYGGTDVVAPADGLLMVGGYE